ncbi:MAG: trypsin-like peptidase domain-containing protein [Firmicutes bacterium]|nr:trypsin-like peptidase domain-containing protein [Bacillota bacterium]
MKIDFKSILIIFLVALLGGYLGNMGAAELNQNKENPVISNNNTSYTTKESSNVKDAISIAYDTVVEIETTIKSTDYFGRESESTALGSGVIISADGYIVTNNHVISGASDIKVKLNGKEYESKLIGTDSKTDIALIKIDETDLTYAIIANSDAVEVGDSAIAIGNPLGYGITVTSGIISALHKEITINNETMDLFQTDAAINSGNSGGGLFNINGELIGIVNAKTSSSILNSTTIEGLGYAIPSNTVNSIVESLLKDGYVKDRPTIGITVTELTQDMNGFEKGLYITEVLENSAASKAGLIQYDRIIGFNDQDITSYNDLSNALKKCEVGDTVTLKIIRNNKEMSVNITLQENIQQ